MCNPYARTRGPQPEKQPDIGAVRTLMRPSPLFCLATAVVLGGCCGPGSFDREVRFDLGVEPVDGPPDVHLDVYAIRLGDTLTVSAQGWETYFGDNGCVPRGPLGPTSRMTPDRYTWSSSAPDVLEVDRRGRIHALREGQAVVGASADGAGDSIRVRVLPFFTALRVTPEEAEVAVGDTVSFIVEALAPDGEPVRGVNFRTAGLFLSQPFEARDVAANTTYSHLDDDPVHFVFVAIAPGNVPLAASLRVVGASDITAEAMLRVR